MFFICTAGAKLTKGRGTSTNCEVFMFCLNHKLSFYLVHLLLRLNQKDLDFYLCTMQPFFMAMNCMLKNIKNTLPAKDRKPGTLQSWEKRGLTDLCAVQNVCEDEEQRSPVNPE